MAEKRQLQVDRIMRYADMIEKQAGRAVRPFRTDGFMNLMNRWGTSKDTTEHYKFVPEQSVPDELLTMFYEGNGLFAKIIDTPAEEAIKHGFELEDVSDQKVKDFVQESLDELDWEETAMTAVKWTRLFGGAIAIMLINDGRGLDEPLDWKNIQSIDDIRVYDRSLIQPDYTSMFNYDPRDPFRTRSSRLGMPEYYHVFSKYGNFTVHDSRCLVFQNGILPENTTNSIYQLWGIPEYVRIHRAIRDAELAHGSAPKMLDRSVQAVYKMKGLAEELATEEGESKVLKRLQTIDLARGLMNSITIDNEGEDYDFRTFQFNGVSDVIDSTCNFLSALTSIPQTTLFGRSPAGMNSTGEGDMENFYNFCERIQKRMLRSNLRYLLSVILQAGISTEEIDEIPKIKVKFNPLWSRTDTEEAELENKRASTQQIRAQTAQLYLQMEVIDPSEIRKTLAKSEEFDVESMLDEYEDEELFPPEPEETQVNPGPTTEVPNGHEERESNEGDSTAPVNGGNAPSAAPTATKLPQDMSTKENAEKPPRGPVKADSEDRTPNTTNARNLLSVGVLVVSEGKILSGTRHNDFGYGLICGPGGHVEEGETLEQAAFRETEEEFGISPRELIPLGYGPVEPDTGLTPRLFLCTDFQGEPECIDLEIAAPKFRTLEELEALGASMFQPFKDGIAVLEDCIADDRDDGGPGSGNHGHEGVPGEIGGSLPNGGDAGLPNMPKTEGEKVLSKFGAGTSIMITKKNGTEIEFTKLGDNQWSRSDQPEYTYEDIGVAGNCWQSKVEVKAKQTEKPADRQVAKEAAEEATNPSSKTVENANQLPKSGKYSDLEEKISSIRSSGKSDDEKVAAYKQTIEETETGTTFKLGGAEYRKTDNPEYPYEALNRVGTPTRLLTSEEIGFEIDYCSKKERGIEFFDKKAQVSGWEETASQLKESGKFSVSDSVHREKAGKITAESDGFGQEGDYVVYRNGSIGSNGMIFLSPKKEGADSYSSLHGNGNTGEYEIPLRSPLVIQGKSDAECIKKAYEALHPEKPISGEMSAKKWISCDKANASALNSGQGGYDSIIYVINGEPSEVQISAKKARTELKKTGEYTVTDWSKSGYTYEEAARLGYITSEADDYERVDPNMDCFADDGVHCSEERYSFTLKEHSGQRQRESDSMVDVK